MNLLFRIIKNKLFLLAFFLVLIMLASSFISKKVMVADISTNTVNTSTVATATKSSAQRKSFYDSVNSLYWVFYNNGSAIAYSYSSNGTSWSSGGTTGIATDDFSVWYVSGTSTVYLAYLNAKDAYVEKGTLSSSSISWGTAVSAFTAAGSYNPSRINITRATNGKLWVVFHYPADATHRYLEAVRSTNADNTGTWDAARTVDSGTLAATGFISSVVVPMTTSGNVYFIYLKADNSPQDVIRGALWTEATSTMGSPLSISSLYPPSYITTSDGIISAVSMDTDQIHLIWNNCVNAGGNCSTGGRIYYYYYSSGSWGGLVSLESNTTDLYPALAIDNTDIYAMYERSNVIYYKKGVSPYDGGSWGSETTLVSSGTNLQVTSSYASGNNYINIVWTAGTGSPYNVQFYGLSPASSPTPTLSPTPSPTPNPSSGSQLKGGTTIKGGTVIY